MGQEAIGATAPWAVAFACAAAALLGTLFATAVLPRAAQALVLRALRRAGPASCEGDPAPARLPSPPRAACAALFGASAALAVPCVARATLPFPVVLVVLCWLVAHAALLTAVLCDLSARVIPWEATCTLFGSGAVLQMLSEGAGGLAAGVLSGALLAALCLALGKAGRALGRPMTIGGGDISCIVALSTTTGVAACAGCAMSFAAAALYGIVCRAKGRDLVPMAPFFCLWFWMGPIGRLL